MQRTQRDRVLLGILLPLWAVCFALSVDAALRPRGFSPLLASRAPAGDYPVFQGYQVEVPEQTAGLRAGDRLVRVGDVELAGASPVEAFFAIAEEARGGLALPIAYERTGERREAMLRLASTALIRPLLLASFAFAFVGAFLVLRARPSPLVGPFFRAFFCSALFFAATFFGSRFQTAASLAVQAVTMTLMGPLNLVAFLRFPSGVAPPGRLARFGPWLFAGVGLLHMSRFGFPPPPAVAIPLAATGVVAFLAAILAAATWNYRRADLLQRRQIKWFLFGLYCAFAPPLVGAALGAYDVRFTPLYVATLSALGLVPIALLIAITRYDLIDIDRLISSTASYNLLLVGLVALSLVALPWAAERASSGLGVEAWVGQVGTALVLAALAVPVQRAVRPRIERAFFPERWALDHGMDQLLAEIPRCGDVKTLVERVGLELTALLRPSTCAAYARRDESYLPIFAVGHAVPPALEAGGPLIATVRGLRGPLTLGESGSRRREALGPFERAVLETLDAAIVLPIRRGDELPVLVCLGRKSSGDVYTPTDVRLLGLLAERVSAEIQRYDQEELVRQGRALQDALRRYVPGAVAQGLERGGDLEPGDREVSVLLVDLRGYTSFCEERDAREIFSTVNLYTSEISQVVADHGGNVVEFNGDGLMAVFGAPEPLHEKEAAAVRAAREIVASVARLEAARLGGRRLDVGVGVATGPAYVGCIRSADRLIWSVLGNTTNLAARLQELTRTYDASVMVDGPTFEGAGGAARGFVPRPGVPIRGRSEPVDAYLLPRPEGAPGAPPAPAAHA